MRLIKTFLFFITRSVFVQKFKFFNNLDVEFFRSSNDESANHFGGYYGTDQISDLGNVLCFEKSNSFTGIRVINASGDLIYSQETEFFNFQDACRYFWVDDSSFIYTTVIDGLPTAKQVDINSGETKILDGEFVGITQNKSLIAINSESYSFFNSEYKISETKIEPYPDQVVMKLVCKTGKNLKSWTNAEVSNLCKANTKNLIVQHSFIRGNKALVFVRAWTNRTRKNYILLLDAEFSSLKVLLEGHYLSHVCWISDDSFIFYDSEAKRGYWKFDISALKASPIKIRSLLRYSDGHPIFISNHIVTDTYATLFGSNFLYSIHLETLEVKLLCRITPPFHNRLEKRCDLHPRYCLATDSLYFDFSIKKNRNIAKVSNVSKWLEDR